MLTRNLQLFPAIRDLGEEIQRTAARDNKPDPKWLPVGREVEPLMSALIELCLQSVQVAPKCYNVNIRALSESTKHLLPHQGARFEHILKAQEGNHTEES